MRAFLTLIFVSVILGTPVHADKIIRKDLGGPVFSRLQEVEAMKREGTRVMVYGRCGSACTLYLGLGERICTKPDAVWYFHGPLARDGKSQLDPWFFEFTSEKMAEQYPPRLARWFMERGRYRQGDQFYTITGAQLATFGVRLCDQETQNG